MFVELIRNRNLDGTIIITIYDSCFVARVVDTCNCRAQNCPETFYHLIKLYERKSLNVSKNLARYAKWLAELGHHAYDELRYQKNELEMKYPAMQYTSKYHRNVLQYMQTKKL